MLHLFQFMVPVSERKKQFCPRPYWQKRPSLPDRAPGCREKKILPFRDDSRTTISFRIVFQPPRKKNSAHFPSDLFRNLCVFLVFPCIFIYFQWKSRQAQGHLIQNCFPAGTEKKICFFRNHHLFQNALLGRNKKKSAADPIPIKHHLIQIAILERNKKKSLVLCSPNPLYISFVNEWIRS